MANGDYIDMERDSGRTVMHVLYGMHTAAPFTFWTLSLVALVVHYVKRDDERNALYVAHHNFTSPGWILVIPGVVAYSVIGLWYLYRCLRGWLRFNDNRLPTEVP
jgi:uncharacterized membrane protein